MKKRFVSKQRKRKKPKLKLLFFVFFFSLTSYLTFQYLLHTNIKIDNKEFVSILLDQYNYEGKNTNKLIKKIKEYYQPIHLLNTSYYNLVSNKKIENQQEPPSIDYSIYIYNSHQTEEYAAKSFLEQAVNPTVMMADYIMEDVFNKNNYKTLVEERSIKQILNENNWKYYRSYDASRIYMEDVKIKNPTLTYFIDVHRDSLTKEKTTAIIDDKSYAKIIFLLGLENEKHQENLDFMTKINDKINEKYPGLSKGIYKKGGTGVNGVYNQDFSKYTILVEIGGVDNTPDEVLNSTLAFTDCFMEVISSNEG